MRLQSATHANGVLSGATPPSPRPITIDVIAYAPVAFFHCIHCELVWHESGVRTRDRREQLDTSLPDDLKEQYQRLSDWVRAMVAAHGGLVRFRVIDAASVEGWMKSLWYGVRQYPAVIVDGTETSMGPEFQDASALIERRLRAARGQRGAGVGVASADHQHEPRSGGARTGPERTVPCRSGRHRPFLQGGVE